jgi:hypothetical protein
MKSFILQQFYYYETKNNLQIVFENKTKRTILNSKSN